MMEGAHGPADGQTLPPTGSASSPPTAWSSPTHPSSRYAPLFASGDWIRALTTPGVQFGLADPRFDATGYRALMVLQLAQRQYHDDHLFADLTVGRFSPPITVTSSGGRDVIDVPRAARRRVGHRPRAARRQHRAAWRCSKPATSTAPSSTRASPASTTCPSWRCRRRSTWARSATPPSTRRVAVAIAFQRFATVKPLFVGAPIAYAVTIPSTAPRPRRAARFIGLSAGAAGPEHPGGRLPAGGHAGAGRPLRQAAGGAAAAVRGSEPGERREAGRRGSGVTTP